MFGNILDEIPVKEMVLLSEKDVKLPPSFIPLWPVKSRLTPLVGKKGELDQMIPVGKFHHKMEELALLERAVQGNEMNWIPITIGKTVNKT